MLLLVQLECHVVVASNELYDTRWHDDVKAFWEDEQLH